MKIRGTQPGDVLQIPLPDGRHAYAQFLAATGLGPLIRVFDTVSAEPVDVNSLQERDQLFPPVYVGLAYALKTERWKVVGRIPLLAIRPVFRQTLGDRPGTYHDWRIVQPDREDVVGDLPANLRSLELLLVWSPQLLEERIATGVNPFADLW